MHNKLSIVVLLSGNGSNLQAIIDQSQTADCPFTIAAVISNRANAYGLKRAAAADIPQHCIEHGQYASREAFDQAMMHTIDQYQPGLVVLAGFMRILTADFVRHYQGRMLNIHPSLLPKYKGLDTHQRAIDAGDQWHGVSIHFVTEELDGGPVILQSRIEINSDDDADSLASRIHQKEHIIYPMVIAWYATGRLSLQDGQLRFDGQTLHAALQEETL